MDGSKINIALLKEMAQRVREKITPYIGTLAAEEPFQRGAGGDISMKIDLLAEDFIVKIIEERGLNVVLISEELGTRYFGNANPSKKDQDILIVDPVDGSANAVRGIPFCSISIAHAVGNRLSDILSAVVMDLTIGDIYWAEKNQGAYWNGHRIHVSKKKLSDDIIFELDADKKDIISKMQKYGSLLEKIYKIRVMGSLALSLCLLARGSIDGLLNFTEGTRIVDMAAGYLIVNEAGGKTFSIDGYDLEDKYTFDDKIPLIATNSNLESFFRNQLMECH
ncbi:MAG: inositol monophosphatase family protein [Promethearchaeota archaeon]